jgi:hypothetical protein
MMRLYTYMLPLALRRGAPVLHFIAKEKDAHGEMRYVMGSAYSEHGNSGSIADYGSTSEEVITRACYEALREQARWNFQHYRAKDEPAREPETLLL